MPRSTFLYENRMFTNKVIWGGKGKDKLTLNKSLVSVRVLTWNRRMLMKSVSCFKNFKINEHNT